MGARAAGGRDGDLQPSRRVHGEDKHLDTMSNTLPNTWHGNEESRGRAGTSGAWMWGLEIAQEQAMGKSECSGRGRLRGGARTEDSPGPHLRG